MLAVECGMADLVASWKTLGCRKNENFAAVQHPGAQKARSVAIQEPENPRFANFLEFSAPKIRRFPKVPL
jgi:hypothetical protein